MDNLQQLFPEPGDTVGYCGAEFQCQPSKNSIHAITDHLDLTGRRRESFFECRGVPQIISSSFLSKNPLVIPIDIQSLDSKGIMNLPHNLTIYGHQYQLAGSTLCSGSHFTAIYFWYGQRLYYMMACKLKVFHQTI